MSTAIRLQTPIVVSSDDVEKALLEQAKDGPAVARMRTTCAATPPNAPPMN